MTKATTTHDLMADLRESLGLTRVRPGSRTIEPLPKVSRRARCCGQPVTHRGMEDGREAMRGCYWTVRRWAVGK